ncbi:hypothetical protein MHU86_11930 [Fragilaria crotonensis]|nr:hypothetical protein MHU86_11930 [Fragilaria crotonensis]
MLFSSLPSLATTMLPVSLFFWGWALKNTLKFTTLVAEAKAKGKQLNMPSVDLGVVSFLTTALSSSFLLVAGRTPISSLSRYAVTGSFILVSINYVLGLLITIKEKPKFAIYCGVFAVLWAAVAYDVNTLIVSGAGY